MADSTPQHKTRQYQDQIYCKVCGKQWDYGESEPPCIDPKEKGRDAIKLMKEKLRTEDDE